MRGSARQIAEYNTNMIALPLIGSIRFVGRQGCNVSWEFI
jgi:hypothetical protein